MPAFTCENAKNYALKGLLETTKFSGAFFGSMMTLQVTGGDEAANEAVGTLFNLSENMSKDVVNFVAIGTIYALINFAQAGLTATANKFCGEKFTTTDGKDSELRPLMTQNSNV